MKNGEQYRCEEKNSIEPLINEAALFLFAQTLLLFSFSLVVLIVYYRIPASYSLVVLKRHKSIRDLQKNGSAMNDLRNLSANQNNAADLVISNLAMDEAAEDKLLRNSMGVDNSKSIANFNGNNSIAVGNMNNTKLIARALPPDPSLSIRNMNKRNLQGSLTPKLYRNSINRPDIQIDTYGDNQTNNNSFI